MIGTPASLSGQEFTAVTEIKDATTAQAERLQQLQGRKITYVGKRDGEEPFKCVLCGHGGKKAHKVVNEKGEEKLVGEGCLVKFFNIRFKAEAGKGKGSTGTVDL